MSDISGRKEQILQAVIEDYINSASPISSADIRDRHLSNLSSATIRNELAALEELGYLYQPHTSAGRVPTTQAYKLYVERLMPKRKLTREELNMIKGHFNHQVLQIKDVLKKTAQVISEVTNYTSLAFVNDITEAVIENIKVVKLTSTAALVIVVTDMGILKDATVTLEEDLSDEFFDSVSAFMLSAFKGYKISEVMNPDKIIDFVTDQYKRFFDTVLDILKKYYRQVRVDDFVLEGTSKLLEYPEYSNVSKAKAVLSMLEAKEELLPILKSKDDMQIHITIGKGEGQEGLSDCAIITANYTVGGRSVGQAGVVGPVRMDYPRVVSVLDYIGKTLGAMPLMGDNIKITTSTADTDAQNNKD